ncbi:MAG: nicotinate phosphoribosyltransferase, partial [Candidatus Heimdallarchaeaceae archaeon]
MGTWIATKEEIEEGKTTDVYFIRTVECLKKEKKDKVKVWAEITAGSVPDEGEYIILLGVEEVIELIENAKLKVNIYAIEEGTLLPPRDYYGVRIPVMVIEGNYVDFAIYETPILGMLCYQSGVGTRAIRLRIAAKNKILLSFGIRRMHPAIAPIIDRACYIAGFDGVSCILSAEKLKVKPTGTIPHALILIEGGIKEAVEVFDKHIEKEVPRVALVDTFNDERIETMIALETLGEKLYGIRLDTPSSRRGKWKELIQEIKWELKLKKKENVKI